MKFFSEVPRDGLGIGCSLLFFKDHLCLNSGFIVRFVLFRIVLYRWFRCLIRCQDIGHSKAWGIDE